MIAREISGIRDDFSVSVKEGKLLYKLAKQCTGKGVIVEIGSWKGYSTICLAKGSMSGNSVPIYAIDTFAGDVNNLVSSEGDTYTEFTQNIAKAAVADVIHPLIMKSEDAEKIWDDTPIELLWIDGDHDNIEADFTRWYPHLVSGGIIALHDTVAWPSMLPYKLAVKEIYKSGKFSSVGRAGSTTYARKINVLTNKDRFRNQISLLTRRIYQLLIPYYTMALILGDKIKHHLLSVKKTITASRQAERLTPEFNEQGMTQWYWRVSHNENFKLGNNTEIGSFTMIDAQHGVTIEDDVRIGFGCTILSNSTIDDKQGQVVLKKGCKVGAGSIIMPNVTIGEGAVVGANSFVSRDVPPSEIWFGSPAKLYSKVRDG